MAYGFRPFFFLALVFASLSIVLWMLIYRGELSLAGPFQPVDWHIHEMLFGYTSAVITGFLFTAIPNWTGRMPIRGKPLAFLALLWVGGRVAVSGVLPLDLPAVAIIDCGLMATILAIVLREIIAGKNWRNLMVVGPVAVFLLANVLFYVEVFQSGHSDHARRLGFAVVTFLIMLIGGRIIPSFTRNWLAKNNPGALPVTMNRFDGACLGMGAASLGAWVLFGTNWVSQAALLGAAALHLVRLLRWQGLRARRSMLLIMLHVAYGIIPLGLLCLGVGQVIAGMHFLGIGAIGGMTLAVMMRATLGHTGRPLQASLDLVLAFFALIIAALVRSLMVTSADDPIRALWIGAALWTLAFTIVLVRMGPWFFRPNPARRKPN